MILKRKWAEDLEVSDDWDLSCKIARHRIYMYWSHPELIPCDEMGIRIPAGHSSFKEKYKESKGKKLIFCFGGSTTMGYFCKYEDSYPHYLEGVLQNTVVFNFGLGGFDCRGSMYLLFDLLRLGYIPDLAIFLDGINEKQGYFQSLNNFNHYEETSYQYGYFSSFLSTHTPHMSLGWKKEKNFMSKIKSIFPKTHKLKETSGEKQTPFKFIVEQSEYHMRVNEMIKKSISAWNIETNFFLQPILWDVWKEETDERYDYIKKLYKNILERCASVVDLSEKVFLKPSDFIDWQHLLGSGNKVLAEAIAEEVKI